MKLYKYWRRVHFGRGVDGSVERDNLDFLEDSRATGDFFWVFCLDEVFEVDWLGLVALLFPVILKGFLASGDFENILLERSRQIWDPCGFVQGSP